MDIRIVGLIVDLQNWAPFLFACIWQAFNKITFIWFYFVFVLFFLWNLFNNVTCDRNTGSYEYIEYGEQKCDVRLPW